MKEALSVLAGLIALGAYVPYAIDIIKGRVRPARSTRFMFVFLLFITILQQGAVHSGLLIMFTAGELIGSVGVLLLAIKHGEGGLSKLDMACYGLLVLNIICWISTGSALSALHLGVVADLIAFTPTLVKTWKRPRSETPIFFAAGAGATVLNIVAAGKYSYSVLLFPVYLAAVNLFELLMILILSRVKPIGRPEPTEPVL